MCDGCKRPGNTYVCTLGKIAYLCAACYARQVRPELIKCGYSKALIDKRIETLIGDPDELEQWMGVCGFAACVREMLKRPTQAQDLFEATFHHLEPGDYDKDFTLPGGGSRTIPFVELIGRASTATSGVKSGYFVDWMLCRALVYVLKVVNISLYNREVKFSDTFNIADWNAVGHFAIQTDSLAYVASSICGLKVEGVLKQKYLSTVKAKREASPGVKKMTTSLKDPDVVARGLAMAQKAEAMLDGSRAMFTAVHTGHIYDGWTDGGVADGVFTANASTGDYTAIDNPTDLPFNHWVIIDGATVSGDKKTVEVDLWTWHTRRNVTYPIEHLTKYLREAIFVKL